jgi:hypothetical protein
MQLYIAFYDEAEKVAQSSTLGNWEKETWQEHNTNEEHILPITDGSNN